MEVFTRFNVTDIEFDFNTDMPEYYGVSPDEAKAITEDAKGICDALDEDDLIEIITDGTQVGASNPLIMRSLTIVAR